MGVDWRCSRIHRIPDRNHCRHAKEHSKAKKPKRIRKHRALPHCALPKLFWRDTPVERQFHHLFWSRLHNSTVDYCLIGICRHNICDVQRGTTARVATAKDIRQQPNIPGIHKTAAFANPTTANIQPGKTEVAERVKQLL